MYNNLRHQFNVIIYMYTIHYTVYIKIIVWTVAGNKQWYKSFAVHISVYVNETVIHSNTEVTEDIYFPGARSCSNPYRGGFELAVPYEGLLGMIGVSHISLKLCSFASNSNDILSSKFWGNLRFEISVWGESISTCRAARPRGTWPGPSQPAGCTSAQEPAHQRDCPTRSG